MSTIRIREIRGADTTVNLTWICLSVTRSVRDIVLLCSTVTPSLACKLISSLGQETDTGPRRPVRKRAELELEIEVEEHSSVPVKYP